MKVPYVSHTTHLEVGQFKPFEKGALKGFFTIIEYPTCRKTRGCRLFVQGNRKWFNMPQEEVKKYNSDQKEYIPFVSLGNQDEKKNFNEAVLKALEEFDDQGNPPKEQETPLQDEPPALWYG